MALLSLRTTATLNLEPLVSGVGDSTEKKESERLAALSIVYQLHSQGIVCHSNLFPGPAPHSFHSLTIPKHSNLAMHPAKMSLCPMALS